MILATERHGEESRAKLSRSEVDRQEEFHSVRQWRLAPSVGSRSFSTVSALKIVGILPNDDTIVTLIDTVLLE